MNLRGGLALIRYSWLSWMQYRSFFFLLAFGWMIPPLIYLFVWSTAAGGETIAGLSRGEFVAYYLVLIVVNQLTYAQTNWTVGDQIRSGGMSRLLLFPMSPVFDALAAEIAGKVVYMCFILPVTALLAIVLKPELNADGTQFILFLLALGLAWLLRFFWGYWLALLAFWINRAESLLALQDALIFIIGGQVAPIALLPDGLRAVAAILPFRYMVSFPVEILTGQVTGSGLLTGFACQSAWLLAAFILYAALFRQGVHRYTAIGG